MFGTIIGDNVPIILGLLEFEGGKKLLLLFLNVESITSRFGTLIYASVWHLAVIVQAPWWELTVE